MDIPSSNHTAGAISRRNSANAILANARKTRPRVNAMTMDSVVRSFSGLTRSINQWPQHAAANRTGTPRANAGAEPLRKIRTAANTAPAPIQTRSALVRHNAMDVIWAEMMTRRIQAQSRSEPLLKGCSSALRTVSTYLAVIATNQRRIISRLAPKICFVARLRTGLYLRPIFMAQEMWHSEG